MVAVQMILGQTPWINYLVAARSLHEIHWNDLIPAVAGAVIAGVGVVLLLTALLPGKPTVLPLAGDLPSGATRHSLRSTLRAAGSTVDGVNGLALNLRGRKISATVRTDRTNTSGLADAVRAALQNRLDQIDPARTPKIRIRVRATRSQS
ncbi:hypothetical protein GCM10009765_21980 [Fodinicola feengrottensis]|uniref:DUF6286 domain-containing protein n=1 Tax=Fodinicola feengrottensis TaxID=435914 RepID=A0ABN2GJB3_9ACTN